MADVEAKPEVQLSGEKRGFFSTVIDRLLASEPVLLRNSRCCALRELLAKSEVKEGVGVVEVERG